ncbi:MAG: CotH kinase family protein [Bacteroidia bacterium]
MELKPRFSPFRHVDLVNPVVRPERGVQAMIALVLGMLVGAWGYQARAQAISWPLGSRGYNLYDEQVVTRIEALLPPDSLARMLNNPNEDREYRCTVVYTRLGTTDTLPECGLRIRGNTSRSAGKKQFRISFNSFRSGQDLEGISDLNLYGMHNDPSISRAKVYYELSERVGAVAARAAHVNLYFNGQFRGVYLNVEHLNEDFMQLRFAQDYGNLFKCLWPADLTYRSNNPNDYKFTSGGRRAYDLMTNTAGDDYTRFALLVRTLTQTSSSQIYCQLDSILDIEATLLTLATDLSSGHWDSYYNKNNFYLYEHPVDRRFRFLPYDSDNTFGIQWGGPNYRTLSPYGFTPGESRPLYDKLMANAETRDIYSFYLRRLANRQAEPQFLGFVDSLRDRIAPFALIDSFRTMDYGFTYAEFLASFSGNLNRNHVTGSITPFLSARSTSTLGSLTGPTNLAPVVHRPLVLHPYPGKRATIRVRIEDELNSGVNAVAWATQDGVTQTLPLLDDGLHGDGSAGDGVYGAYWNLNPGVQQCSVQVRALDAAQNQRIRPCNPMRVNLRTHGPLVINEIMALNRTGIRDQSNQTSDWVELHNTGSVPFSLNGVYLTDNMAEPGRWRLPNVSVPAGGFVLVWASGDTTRGPWHAGFTLSGYGECLGLHRLQGAQFTVLDTLCYGPQAEDVAWGRAGDGALDWLPFLVPTPERSNGAPSGTAPVANAPWGGGLCPARPNPFRDQLTLDFPPDNRMENPSDPDLNPSLSWTIQNNSGQTIDRGQTQTGPSDTHTWPPGLYHLLWQDRHGQGRCKLLKLP